VQDALRLRDEFLSIAAHELNTPVTSLQLAVQTLAAQMKPGGRLDLRGAASATVLDIAQRQAKHLVSLVSDLLDVSRLRVSGLRLTLSEVDLAEVTRDVAERFGPELARAGCVLTLEAKKPVIGTWDRSRLEQVLFNLLSNSTKYGAGAPIEVSVDAVAGVARLVVVDHGVGIAPERQKHIFRAFERAAPVSNFGGLGLGLYIVKSIVDALGGTVRVESEPGTGSTFVVELPQRRQE
jgi:signal transduction histidine kinase